MTNEGAFNIVNANTAGITSITTDGGITSFFGANTAGTATIVNINNGTTGFFDTSSAGSANITNSSGGTTTFGIPGGLDTSTAANATIDNNNGGTIFAAMTNAGTANITNHDSGGTIFLDFASAASATITNNNNGFTFFGLPFGTDAPTGGNAAIINNSGGETDFNAFATAGSATITTKNGGKTFFYDNSTGGNARFITNGSGFVDFSGSTGPAGDGRITAGSIEGSGTYYIGAGNTLIVGGNNLSTEVSGVIADSNPCGCFPAGPGTLEKVGTGTLTLSGSNTYSGGTIITSGTLQLGNGGALGSIVGNVTDNGIFAINRSDVFTFSDVISGGGAFQQLGTGTTTLTAVNTYAGLTTVTAGTLQIAAGGSVAGGVLNNATFINAGAVSGGLTNNATVNAIGGAINGAIANNAGGTFNVAGTVTSDSTFSNAAGGTLAVGGTGTYTLQGLLTNSGAVTVADGGHLIATVGGITNRAGGTITVAAGGTVADDLNNAGIVTNNGAYSANVATNTGAMTNNGTWTGNVASNAGTITNNTTWTGTVSNAGTFNNNAGATVSGLLTNTAGTTNNNGTLSGGANITGGTLTGSGTVSNLTVAGGATFAPGNGTPGTSMAVTGSLALQSGALYLVQINPATASFVNVTGTATLGGATVNAVYSNGSFVSKRYTIVSATGGVGGTFNSLVNTNLPSSFTPSLSYDTTHAYLDLTLNFTPPPSAPNFGGPLNINQQNVANALVGFFNSNGSIPLVFGALTPTGLTIASGELAVGSQQTTFDAMNLFLGLLTDPFIAGREALAASTGAPAFADAGSAYASGDKWSSSFGQAAHAAVYRKAPAVVPTFDQRWSVWAAGYGGSQTTSGNAVTGSNTATSRIYGAAAGADYRISPYTVAGFALAGGGTGFNIANGLGDGRSYLFQAGAFIHHTVGSAYLRGALAYGWQDVTTNRTVTIAGIDQLQARFNSNAFSGRIEGGYRFATPWMGVVPYAAGQSTRYFLPAYAEQVLSGASTFALKYASKDITMPRSELGLRTDSSYAVTDAILTLRSRFAWVHNFNTDPSIAPQFQTLPGASFVVNGAAAAHDAALTTASTELKWRNGYSLSATFEGEFSSTTSSYAGKGVARYQW